jgi:putative endonuclease
MADGGFAYLMASGRHGTLYCGVTSDLMLRVSQHREGVFAGFTTRYQVKRLVWHEHFFRHSRCDCAGEADQELAAGVEVQSDRGG